MNMPEGRLVTGTMETTVVAERFARSDDGVILRTVETMVTQVVDVDVEALRAEAAEIEASMERYATDHQAKLDEIKRIIEAAEMTQ